MSLSDLLSSIDGSRRQQVAAGLWAVWQEEGHEAAILTGFSGLGKTEQVVRPLLNHAIQEGRQAVLVEIPLYPTSLEEEVIAELVDRLRESGADTLAQQVGDEPSLSAALGRLLRGGALVVLDEFQRLLDPTGQPFQPLGDKLQRLARRAPDGGCLWLVTNRQIDPTWTEPFYETLLEPPAEFRDQERIVLDAIATADAEKRFPDARRLEVVRRLGANPRVLRLLGALLRMYPLEELLGPPGDVLDAPADPRLTEGMERALLAKAEEGLSDPAKQLLRDLSVLRGPASWELVEAVAAPLGDVRVHTRALRERYLLEIRANRYHLHPVVREVEGPRLRRDEASWRDAHRRAGMWYSRPLYTVDRYPLGDTDLAFQLAGARYHLVEAQATDVLHEAMRGVRSYIERKYGWSTRKPASDEERDAQISLLGLYLEEPGDTGVEFTYAKLLKQRGAPGDLEAALPHAMRATEGRDFHNPWVLWIQLVREVEGLEAAVAAAQEAKNHVAPAKNLFTVYQLLGGCLDHLSRTEEAVDALLEGAARDERQGERLIEEALFFAAAHHDIALLQRIRAWMATREGFGHQVALAGVVLLERRGEWRQAAEAAQDARAQYATYLNLALHEGLCWLGAGKPERAQEALDRLPEGWYFSARESKPWLASMVTLHQGQEARAAGFLATYLDADAPTTAAAIRAALLREWDHRVATVGEPNPALIFPILPTSVTGLDHDVRRPQHGPPVLPQHRQVRARLVEPAESPPCFLALGTEWQSGQGGLSTFNRQLCCALAAAGVRVVCLVVQAAHEDIQEAAAQGVTLVTATATPGRPAHEALTRRPALPDGFAPDFIIGHGRVTGPAAKVLAEDHFPDAKRLHIVHMAPDEIEWYKLDREDDAGARAEERTQVELDLGRTAARVIGVGPRLYNRYLRDLSAYDTPAPIRLDPGFDTPDADPRTPPPGEPWSILMLGRLEDYRLKGLDIAAGALGLVADRRSAGSSPLELLVRGAPPGTSASLLDKIREWAGPSLRVVVRPYTSDADTLDADLRRASVLLMPSRSEGFGLVGLEAIVAGTPALISSESGLGQLLQGTLETEQANRFVVLASGDDAQDIETWSRAIEGVLRDRDAAFRRAAEVRTLLGRRKTWAAAMASLMAEMEPVLAT
jgi:glycosyltransferase involved in cell wall biosynthesis